MTADRRAALIEKVARAIYECWCGFHAVTDTSMPWVEVEGDERDLCLAEATAAIDLIRAEVMEEAARECLEELPLGNDEWTDGYRLGCEENARNIRALKGDANGR